MSLPRPPRRTGDARRRVWYAAGLRFSCTRCGNCCRGPDPGYVWVGEEEIDRLCEHLGLERNAFGGKYLRRIGDRLSLTEKPVSLDCVFWDEARGCSVYEARPTQCRSFPFWPENVRTPSDWEDVAKGCPGIGEGKLHPLATIEREVASTPEVEVPDE